jgi:hypothetical protein
MVIEYIPEKWRNLRLEYTDEYITYIKEKKLKKESIHEPKIMKKPIKQPDSILKNKSDVYNEKHKGGVDCDKCANKDTRCNIL